MPLPKNLFWHVRIQRAFKARRNGPQHFRSKRIVMLREPERYCQGEPLNGSSAVWLETGEAVHYGTEERTGVPSRQPAWVVDATGRARR